MTRRIYHVITQTLEEWDFSARTGATLVRREAIQPSDTYEINHEGKKYEIQQDGAFEVPDDVAKYFLRMPGWFEGSNPFTMKKLQEDAEAARAPRKTTREK